MAAAQVGRRQAHLQVWVRQGKAGPMRGQAPGTHAKGAAACQQLCSTAGMLCRALLLLRRTPSCALQLLTRHAADNAHRREEEDALGQGALSQAAQAPGA
jgi:hypothetical protein